MTREEYLQLVQSSKAFQKMDPLLQQKILLAEGEAMAEYAKVFQDEQKFLLQAKTDFLNKNEEISKNYVVEVKKLKRNTFINAEKQSTQADKHSALALIKKINKI